MQHFPPSAPMLKPGAVATVQVFFFGIGGLVCARAGITVAAGAAVGEFDHVGRTLAPTFFAAFPLLAASLMGRGGISIRGFSIVVGSLMALSGLGKIGNGDPGGLLYLAVGIASVILLTRPQSGRFFRGEPAGHPYGQHGPYGPYAPPRPPGHPHDGYPPHTQNGPAPYDPPPGGPGAPYNPSLYSQAPYGPSAYDSAYDPSPYGPSPYSQALYGASPHDSSAYGPSPHTPPPHTPSLPAQSPPAQSPPTPSPYDPPSGTQPYQGR